MAYYLILLRWNCLAWKLEMINQANLRKAYRGTNQSPTKYLVVRKPQSPPYCIISGVITVPLVVLVLISDMKRALGLKALKWSPSSDQNSAQNLIRAFFQRIEPLLKRLPTQMPFFTDLGSLFWMKLLKSKYNGEKKGYHPEKTHCLLQRLQFIRYDDGVLVLNKSLIFTF